jgi:hypothetical protein
MIHRNDDNAIVGSSFGLPGDIPKPITERLGTDPLSNCVVVDFIGQYMIKPYY